VAGTGPERPLRQAGPRLLDEAVRSGAGVAMTSNLSANMAFLRSVLAVAALTIATSAILVEGAPGAEHLSNASCGTGKRMHLQSAGSCSVRACYAADRIAETMSMRSRWSNSEGLEISHARFALACTRTFSQDAPTFNQ
jgi:hypothetical protein